MVTKKGQDIINELEGMHVHENIINKVRERCITLKENDIKLVLSLAGGAATGTVGNLAIVYFLKKYNLMQYFDEVWGVSAGSMIGAAYCSGMDLNDIVDTVCNVRLRDFVRVKLAMPFATDQLHSFFEKMLPIKTFEECIKPFYVLACAYTEDHQHIDVFSSGSLADAVTASISIPHVFEPFKLNGATYFDGGLVENTPNKSVLRNHYQKKDPRRISIISTCFGKASLQPNTGTPISNLINTLGYYRYRLQLEQNQYVRSQPGVWQLMLNFEINGITKLQFNKMDTQVVSAYGQLLDKLSYVCAKDAWNIDY